MATKASARPITQDQVPAWDIETDVVVVGYSIAGVCAALGATEVTDRVVALERGGGSEGTCGGILYLGGGTPMQQAMGHHDTADAMYTFLLAALGPGVDEDKLRRYCDGSVEHFRWLFEAGVPLISGPDREGTPLATPDPDGFVQVGAQEYAGGGLVWTGGEQAHPFNQLTAPVPRGHMPRDPDGTEDLFEGAVLKCLLAAAERAGVRTVFNTGVERLVVDDAGRVVGVAARSFGTAVFVRAARGVIITTGGFVYNDEMLGEHCTPAVQGAGKLGHGGQDGLGIQMAQMLGADAIHMDAIDATLVSTPHISFIKGILVNSRGQRFINEDTYYGRLGTETVLRQHSECYLVVDENIFLESSWLRPAWASDSLQDLEQQIGLPDGALQQTVDYYNRGAEAGEDPLFHKGVRWLQPLSPPYAVLDLRHRSFPIQAFTMGGLRTDAGGHVLDVEGRPIDGLFAAGRASAGLAVHGYCSGISLGDGSFFGRIAGQTAARNPIR
ncbi:FAD-dependent oxidoreductase [Dactylosporangium sp. NPDC051484]|uniref:FAD-dependent oxidoreductase n=1 Tax=Dactylosporangium sp. NPDC051484 TaxID=3154942 RepID=UPI00344C8D63